MEFGKVTDEELKQIDFTLPPDPSVNNEVLKKGKGKTKFYVGCAKWGRKDWVGKLYPVGTKEKDFLEHYAHIFNCIEFNATFYKSPSPDQVRKWKEKVPKGFLFCPKFTQSITHLKRLKNVQAEMDAFLEAITEFKENMGPIFLLPNPQMSPKHVENIENFIEQYPKDMELFLELRHPDWYTTGEGYDPGLFNFLKKHKRGTIITDAAGRRDCVHMHLSTPEAFIRFVGNSLHPTDYTRIDEWVQRIKQWMKQGLETCYFFMHQHEELHSPELIKYFIEELNKHCGTKIEPPKMQYEGGLFG
jgi:uncharacterized protein YecE (DUF72 family)